MSSHQKGLVITSILSFNMPFLCKELAESELGITQTKAKRLKRNPVTKGRERKVERTRECKRGSRIKRTKVIRKKII